MPRFSCRPRQLSRYYKVSLTFMAKPQCTDRVVGAILASWRYDISGISPEMSRDYEQHFADCSRCRARLKFHRSLDVSLVVLTSLSVFFSLFALAVFQHIKPLEHVAFNMLGLDIRHLPHAGVSGHRRRLLLRDCVRAGPYRDARTVVSRRNRRGTRAHPRRTAPRSLRAPSQRDQVPAPALTAASDPKIQKASRIGGLFRSSKITSRSEPADRRRSSPSAIQDSSRFSSVGEISRNEPSGRRR